MSGLYTHDELVALTGGQPAPRLHRRTRRAWLVIGALAVILLLMASVLRVGGAVIGMGSVSVETRVNTIQHPSGGVLTEMLVREGQRVAAGQPLLRLDTSISAAGAQSARLTADDLAARRARLEAERDGATAIRWPAALTAADSGSASAAMRREQRLFALRNQEIAGSRTLLAQRVRQFDEQINSYVAQIAAIDQQRRLIEPELAGLRELYAKRLTPLSRINQLERTAVQLDGSRAALEANIAEARARISETREQMLTLEQRRRSEAAGELAQVLVQSNDQDVRRASADDALNRSVVTAPFDGVVDKLFFATPGSALPPMQPLVQIVPADDLTVIEAQIRPEDVDQVRRGQRARARFSALNRELSPEIDGRLVFVSPERTVDERLGISYYRVRVAIDKAQAERELGPLTAGMPVEVYIATGDRTILSYLFKPMTDLFNRSMRDGD